MEKHLIRTPQDLEVYEAAFRLARVEIIDLL